MCIHVIRFHIRTFWDLLSYVTELNLFIYNDVGLCHTAESVGNRVGLIRNLSIIVMRQRVTLTGHNMYINIESNTKH